MEANSTLFLRLIRRLILAFRVSNEMENQEVIYENIRKGASLKGTNLWVLICAIIIASVGLNISSESILIGAMLISPLMGTVVGMGYGIATYNFQFFHKSLRTLLFAVGVSLLSSTLYFLLTPISASRSNLLSVLSPSIYDVIIAFFGGMAGIITTASKSKGNAIPGAAVATALLPPICKAGYGISVGNISFAINALYLFAINMVFIAFAALLISKILRLPAYQDVAEEQRKRINRYLSIVLIFVTLPSFYFAYQLVQKGRFQAQAERYVKSVSIFEDLYLLRNEIDADNKKITLIYGGSGIDAKREEAIKRRAGDFLISASSINIQGGLVFDNNSEEDAEKKQMRSEIDRLYTDLRQNKQQLDSILADRQIGRALFLELRALFPKIMEVSYAPAPSFAMAKDNSDIDKTTTNSDSLQKSADLPLSQARVWIIVRCRDGRKIIGEEHKKLQDWLQVRLGKMVEIFYK